MNWCQKCHDDIAPLFQDALNGEQEPSVKWVAH